PRRAAVLGGVGIGGDLELLYRVDRRPHHLRSQFLYVLRDRVVVDAVQQKIVLQRVHAVNADTARASETGAASLGGKPRALNARHHRQQVVPAPQQQGKARHIVGVDDAAE